MAIRNRTDYEHTLAAVGVCIAARIPVLLWGSPGEGKTTVIESARASGWQVETVIVSHYEPSDFTGLPVIGPDGSVSLAPPAWAKRLANAAGPAICFFDELSTASPAIQAAALRPLTHYEVGELELPSTVSFVAAANPADIAASGWELAAPTASRFVHLDWAMPLDVYAECSLTDEWPALPLFEVPEAYQAKMDRQRALVSGFLRARGSLLSVIPAKQTERGRAFPTPRTWDYAAHLAALATALDQPSAVAQLLVAGCIGAEAAHEFLAWAANNDLPDPEVLLAEPAADYFGGMRPDRVYATLQSVLAAVAHKRSTQRWTAAVQLCCNAALFGNVDPAVPVVRALLGGSLRPASATLPSEIAVFKGPLALAGLL